MPTRVSNNVSKTKPLIFPSKCTSLTGSPSQLIATPSFQQMAQDINLSATINTSPLPLAFNHQEVLLALPSKYIQTPRLPTAKLPSPLSWFSSGASHRSLSFCFWTLQSTLYTVTRVRVDPFQANLLPPLLNTPQCYFPLGIKARPVQWPPAPTHLTSAPSLPSYHLPCALCSSHTSLKHSRHFPASGPLLLMFSLPGMLCPQTSSWLIPLPPSGFDPKSHLSIRPTLTKLFVSVPTFPSTLSIFSPYPIQLLISKALIGL